MEIPRKTASAAEIGILWDYLSNRLLGEVRETNLTPMRKMAHG